MWENVAKILVSRWEGPKWKSSGRPHGGAGLEQSLEGPTELTVWSSGQAAQQSPGAGEPAVGVPALSLWERLNAWSTDRKQGWRS